MNLVAIKDIVRSISRTHKFDKDSLKPINTSDVYGGEMFDVPYSETSSLKGQFKKTIQKDDILFSEIRPANRRFGRVQITDTKDYVVSTKLMVLRKFNDGVDLDYFYYCLTNQAFLDILQRRAENRIGSFPQITFDLLGEYKFPMPPLEEQHRIASIIANIDAKIKVNQEINRNLEAMARQLYDYWFVQFDFPDENGKPYKSSGGKMVWNEKLKREIPEGWTDTTLGRFCEMYQPKTISTDELNPEGKYWVYGANGIVGKYDTYNHENSEIAMACRGNSCGIINRTLPKSWITGNAMVIRPRIGIHNEFIYQAIPYLNINGAISGSGQPQLTRENLSSVLMCNPTINVLSKFSDMVSPYVDLRIKNEIAIQDLIRQRDEFLPLLMNGQVSVIPSEVNCDLSHD